MPRPAPTAPLTGAAGAAHHAIQNETRLNVLRTLLHLGTATRAEITTETGITVSSTLAALKDLEAAGYVRASVDGDRAGHRVTYCAARQRITADLFDFMAWLLG